MPVKMNHVRRGLVLSGGAALGAYQAGALKALRQCGVSFDVISATSIGILQALAWNVGDLILSIDHHWLDNVRGLKPFQPRRLLSRKNPIQYQSALLAVFNTYRDRYPFGSAPVEILVSVTDYHSGHLRVFSTADPQFSREEQERFLAASTVMPHLGGRPITLDGGSYCDGAYREILPLGPLLNRGLDEIWLIPLFPLANPLGRLGGTIIKPPVLHSKVSNPSLRLLLGLLDQLLHPRDLRQLEERLVVVSPHGWLQALRTFNVAHALTFSQRNVRRLLTRGHRDGRRAFRSYQDSGKMGLPV